MFAIKLRDYCQRAEMVEQEVIANIFCGDPSHPESITTELRQALDERSAQH